MVRMRYDADSSRTKGRPPQLGRDIDHGSEYEGTERFPGRIFNLGVKSRGLNKLYSRVNMLVGSHSQREGAKPRRKV